ncbi:MAG: SDR family oxidoreductase [bacterium]
MDLGLKDKRALVTGASAGLGFAAAAALAAEGVRVTINGRDRDRLEKAAERIHEATKQTPACIAGDVSKSDDCSRLVREAGDVDILVSNAGGPPPGQFLEHTPERWQEAHDLVLRSAVNLTYGVLQGMIDRGWGRIIYITSIGVLQPVDALVLSNAYRAGVTGMCKTLSGNYARHGITFNCVCPGYTATERLNNLARTVAEQSGQTPEQVIDGFAGLSPAGRVGKPEELAALITFLAGRPAAYISGASIPCDGGLYRGLV